MHAATANATHFRAYRRLLYWVILLLHYNTHPARNQSKSQRICRRWGLHHADWSLVLFISALRCSMNAYLFISSGGDIIVPSYRASLLMRDLSCLGGTELLHFNTALSSNIAIPSSGQSTFSVMFPFGSIRVKSITSLNCPPIYFHKHLFQKHITSWDDYALQMANSLWFRNEC